jgi:hypothetical protein
MNGWRASPYAGIGGTGAVMYLPGSAVPLAMRSGVPRLGPRMIRMRAPRRNEHGLLTGRAEKSHANGFVLINGLVQSEDQQ